MAKRVSGGSLEIHLKDGSDRENRKSICETFMELGMPESIAVTAKFITNIFDQHRRATLTTETVSSYINQQLREKMTDIRVSEYLRALEELGFLEFDPVYIGYRLSEKCQKFYNS